MTVNYVISRMKPYNYGKYDDRQLIEWLNELDAKIHETVMKQYTDGPAGDFDPHTGGEDNLIIPFMFFDVYRYYLAAKIYEANGEGTAYNNAFTAFTSEYNGYCNWYRMRHKPKSTNITF